MSGISGSSLHSVASLSLSPDGGGGGAPKAAGGGLLLKAVGLGVSIGRTLRLEILGGLSGRGAAAGVLGVEVRKVRTMTSADSDSPHTLKVDTVVVVV